MQDVCRGHARITSCLILTGVNGFPLQINTGKGFSASLKKYSNGHYYHDRQITGGKQYDRAGAQRASGQPDN